MSFDSLAVVLNMPILTSPGSAPRFERSSSLSEGSYRRDSTAVNAVETSFFPVPPFSSLCGLVFSP